jgi:hypothetical protein
LGASARNRVGVVEAKNTSKDVGAKLLSGYIHNVDKSASGCIPSGFVLKGFIPSGFVLKGFFPSGFVQKGFFPSGFVLKGFIPSGFVHFVD